MRHLVFAAGVAAFTVVAPAAAAPGGIALLTELRGAVLVDTGEGFARVSEDVRLKMGDRVMVTDNGAATLSYGTDCSFPLQSPSVITIEETVCATATQGETGGGEFSPLLMAAPIGGSLGLLGSELATGDDGTPASP